jgi:hypothetical protein
MAPPERDANPGDDGESRDCGDAGDRAGASAWGEGMTMTVEAAAASLGISAEHVRELIRASQLEAVSEEGPGELTDQAVARYRERRRRQLEAARNLGRISRDSPGGWDS